jgi:hypothetical protein
MSMYEYAKREIELAKALEVKEGNLDPNEFDYSGACYDSALKAFKSLTEDNHSGFSIGLTKYILNRLIDGTPLTPIVDTNDIWNEIPYDKEPKFRMYQCNRMSTLFKNVYDDGRITYNDLDAIQCVNVNTNDTYHFGLVEKIVGEQHPITFPYMPPDTPIRVYCDEFLTDKKNGDFDTVGIIYLIRPDNTKIIIDRYFKEVDKEWIEIKDREYIARYQEATRGI